MLALMKHLVLVDGHHLMYRAYWAIPRTLTTRAGEQVNSVFGFASMIFTILKKEEPDAFLLCFDAGEATFRHEENATYKDGRAETPDDFYTQIPRIQEFVRACNFAQVALPKYEADDLLCTYARAAEKAGMRVTIVTGDRDALQLASKNIRIAIPHSAYQGAEYLGPEEIVAKYGIRPDQVPAYKGLIGDTSDNLPGVKGIGPKTAATLLQEYDTLESIYEHIADIKPSIRSKLEADREQAFFCQRMALLVSDIPLSPTLDEIGMGAMPVDDIRAFFTSLDFTILSRRFEEFLRSPYGMRLNPGAVKADIATENDASVQMTLFS